MNKDELIKLGLSEEQAASVLQLAKPMMDAQARLESINQELSQAKSTIAERDKQIDGLKTANSESKALQKQIEQLQAENREAENKYKAELLASRKSYAVKQALLEAEQKPQNVKIVMDQIDLDKVFIDDSGNLTGLQEQQMRLLKDAPSLFKTESAQPQVKNGFTVHGAGAQPQPQQNEQKPAIANADFGRKLAAITLQSQGLPVPNNTNQEG